MQNNAIPTPAGKLRKLEQSFVFTCRKTLDVDGAPVSIKVKRIPRIELLPLIKSAPQAIAHDDSEAPASSDALLVEKGIEFIRIASRLLCMVAIEPAFSELGDGDGASVDAIDEEDRASLFEAYMRFCGYIADDEASQSVARFRTEVEGGGLSGEQASAVGLNVEAPQQPAGY